MKKYLWILCALLFATLAVACSDDDDAPSNVSVVTLSDTQITLVRGERYTLTARVETLDGKGCDVTWATSDGRVVTVDAEGNLTAGETGSARVYALAENRQAVCDVTVTLPGEAHVGDYYYSDGTYSADLNPKKECIGVVFQVGQHANDRSDYSQTGIGEAACHGYVVALQDASEELCLWGVYGYEIGLYPVDDSGNKIDTSPITAAIPTGAAISTRRRSPWRPSATADSRPTRRRAIPSVTTPGSSHRRFRLRPTRAAGSFPPSASSARSTGCVSSSMPGRG
jgi:Bacterial surface proteins containing Ig-like domains